MTEEAAQSLGKYRPIAVLGQGGMARVLLTVAEGPAAIQKLLVVKEIRPELAKDYEFVTMFMDEARLAARLNHPNLIQTYEVGEHDGRPFIVMEYLEGQPLHALMGRVGRPNVPMKIQLTVLSKVLAGLHYAHELKGYDGAPLSVVHRDVSPQNVFVCYDGQVKLVDFGIAKAAGSVARTQTGVFKGKLGYVAPEQITSSMIDRRADLYSIGVMLWETLAKRRLTSGDGEAAVLHKRTNGLHPKIREFTPDAPPELADICDRAMALLPDERFTTAAEMQVALDHAIDALGLRATDPEMGDIVQRTFQSEREKLHAVLEQQLSNPPRISIDSLRTGQLPSLAREESVPLTLSPSVPPPLRFPSAPPPAPLAFEESTPNFRKRSPLIWAAGAIGILAIGAVLGFAALHGDGPSAATSTTSSAAASAAPVVTAPPVDTVQVSIQVHPDSAHITIDGVVTNGNPFHTTVSRDGHAHKVAAQLQGYTTEERLVSYDHDVVVEMNLKKFGAPVTNNYPTLPTAPTSSAVDPGTDLKNPTQKPKHTIDDKDPYQ
mgnify:CR=1 FL=1